MAELMDGRADGWSVDWVNAYNACAAENRDFFIISSEHNFMFVLLNVSKTK